eukprot:403358693
MIQTLSTKYLTSDCAYGCYNSSDTTPEYYCENPNKVGYCCPSGSTDKECVQNTTASIFCSNKVKTINAKWLYCVTFESACQTSSNYINATDSNVTIQSEAISDKGFTCWWEISLDRTVWNQNATAINIYILSPLTNLVVYVGSGLNRENVTSLPSTTTAPKSYKINATSNAYIAVVPQKGKFPTNFTMIYNIQGSKIEEDLSFQTAFWNKAIGIIAGAAGAFILGIAGWLVYQKYGCSGIKNAFKGGPQGKPQPLAQTEADQTYRQLQNQQNRKQQKDFNQIQDDEEVKVEDYDEDGNYAQDRQQPQTRQYDDPYDPQRNGTLKNAFYQNQKIIQNLRNQLGQ